MDNERIREICLGLPHVTEAVGWGHHLVFWVGDKAIGGKMFALIHLDDAGTGVVWFHAGPERYAELLETEGIVPAPYMAKAHWLTVMRWDALRPRQLEEELRQAHGLVFEKLPKKVKAVLALPEKERLKLIRERKRRWRRRRKRVDFSGKQQIPNGNDSKKNKNNGKSRSFPSFRMTMVGIASWFWNRRGF